MPIPKPKKDENKEDFMGRCMMNKTMVREYPKQSQRYAVCLTSWNKKSDKD